MIAFALMVASQAIAAPPDLSAFAPFLDACWRTEFSVTVQDTHCFEMMYGVAHVRDRHEVRDAASVIYAGETTYSLDGPDLVFTYYNSLGGVGRGKIVTTGRTLRFTGRMRASPGKPEQPIDSEWRLVDATHYEVRSLVPTKSGQPDKPLVFTKVVEAPTN